MNEAQKKENTLRQLPSFLQLNNNNNNNDEVLKERVRARLKAKVINEDILANKTVQVYMQTKFNVKFHKLDQ